MTDEPENDGITIRAFTIEDREAACFARLHLQIEIPDDDEPDGGSELEEQQSA